MPNWCENRLSVSGPKETIAKIIVAIKVDQGEFNFNGIVPMPPELNITAGSSTSWGEDILYGDWARMLGLPVWRDQSSGAGSSVMTSRRTKNSIRRPFARRRSPLRPNPRSRSRSSRSPCARTWPVSIKPHDPIVRLFSSTPIPQSVRTLPNGNARRCRKATRTPDGGVLGAIHPLNLVARGDTLRKLR